jgi:flagellar hook protein FlgE
VLRSLFSGITGLRQHQTLMDVVSNNISNVNTTGFKASSVVFEDTLSQVIKNATAPGTGLGGMNPAQVGLGVQLGGISTNFGQGSAQNTGKPTDLMVQGDGFFVVQNGTQQAYTRAGAFNFDTDGKLVNSEGMVVQGWMPAAIGGPLNTDAPLTGIKLPSGTQIPPTASSKITAGGNIEAGTTTPLTLGAVAYDKTGGKHALTITLTPNGTAFDVNATDATDPATTVSAGTLQFVAGGAYDPASTAATITTADGTAITLDLSGVTQFGGPKTLALGSVDGFPSGTLQQFQINLDGGVMGIFSNSQKILVGKIALANFNNPSGMNKIGATAFVSTVNSGLPQIGEAGTGGRGQLLGSALEMSNVDLAQEFTNMIIAQRGFQANSRVITTSDQMLQDLVDLKR